MAYILLIFLPLIGFLNINLFGFLIGYLGCFYFLGIIIQLCWFLSLYVFFLYLLNYNSIILNFGNWFFSGNLNVDFIFVFDSLSVFMLLLIFTVTLVVIFFSMDYMLYDPFLSKFLSYLILFSFFMTILVTSRNFCLLLVGWEGVGICSFLLISFWSSRIKASKAALKAIIFNRIGDMGILAGVAITFSLIKSVDIYMYYCYLPFFFKSSFVFFGLKVFLIDFILFFFFIGVMGKSAQVGLHVWLLDAMEGPTPVSALIHAATMVTAGVFLLLRLSFIIEFSVYIKSIIIFVGTFTAFFSAIVGLYQTDIKSIIAYSTCSQLGYMVALCGVSGYYLSLFHLINHGFFKSLLFLSSGMLIHSLYEEQDIRRMGGLFYLFPLTYCFFLIGSFSLCGVPFLSGYYSKDYIFEYLITLPLPSACFSYVFLLLSALFTTMYSIRLIYFVFISAPNSNVYIYKSSFEYYGLNSLFGMNILVFLSIFSGYLLSDIFIGFGSNFFSDSLSSFNNYNRHIINSEFILFQNYTVWFTIKFFPIYVFFLSFFFFYVFYIFNSYVLNPILFYFFYSGMFYNFMYIEFICIPFLNFCFELSLVDKIYLENFFFLKFKYNLFKFSNLIDKFYTLKNSYSNLYIVVYIFLLFFFILLLI